jgi:hypothetical protein
MVKKILWNEEQGSSDLGKDGPLKRQPDKGWTPGKDISKKVDSNWKVNNGFAGKLTSED